MLFVERFHTQSPPNQLIVSNEQTVFKLRRGGPACFDELREE